MDGYSVDICSRPLIAALVLAADAGGDLASLDNTSTAKHHSVSEHGKSVIFFGKEGTLSEGGEEEEKNMYALSFFILEESVFP